MLDLSPLVTELNCLVPRNVISLPGLCSSENPLSSQLKFGEGWLTDHSVTKSLPINQSKYRKFQDPVQQNVHKQVGWQYVELTEDAFC